MRTCPNCQAEFADHEVFCPVCGQEVQLVADFVTMESQAHAVQQQLQESERQRAEERIREEMRQQRVRQRRRHILIALCALAAVAIAVLVGMFVRAGRQQEASFDYQIAKARSCVEDEEWSQAENHIRQALRLAPEDPEILLLASRILTHNQAGSEAEMLLLKLIELQPDHIEAYRMLFDLYMEEERIEDIQTILRSCKEDTVLETFRDYLPEGPHFSVEEGTYNEDLRVEITAEQEGKIHYTTDGSQPDGSSPVYTEPLTITEGITTVKAILITREHGFKSLPSAAIYQIQYDAPPAPVIDPSSGTYTVVHYVDNKGVMSSSSDKDKTITLTFPAGYTCRYSFDKKPTKDSPTYQRPIPMEKGEHIFYAVLESPNGKLGTIASATYKYEIKIVTPTPSPRPVYYNQLTPTSTEEPTPTETPTPTPTATPDPTPEPTPESAPEPTPAEGGSTTPETTPSDNGSDTPAPAEGGSSTPADGGSNAPAPEEGGSSAPAEGGSSAPADSGGEAVPPSDANAAEG